MGTLKTIEDHRDLILLAEIGALIHDLGKLSKEFVIQQSIECYKTQKTYCPECEFHHEKILTDSANFLRSTLVNLLQDSKWRLRLQSNMINQLKQAPEHLGHFISSHTNIKSGVGLLALVARCDQVDSGVDKGALQNSAKQSCANTQMTSAFGYEHGLSLDSGRDNLKMVREELCTSLEDMLSRLLSSNTPLSSEDRAKILRAIRNAYRQALGETRRAANDVTLWNHTYSVASLQKAALAQVLLKGEWPKDLRKELQWRILRLTFNGLQFLEHAHRTPDILGRLQVVQKALDNVRTLLEVTLPLGNEIYRDENGSAFIVPNANNLLEIKDNQGKSLSNRIVEEFDKELRGEIWLDLSNEWFSNPSRYAVELGRLLNKPLPPLTADPQLTWNQWETREGVEVCTVCTLRPIEPSTEAIERNVCDICERRRGSRAKQWINNMRTTIWTDEVADTNGLLALVVGYFDLTAWLKGLFSSSVLAQKPPVDRSYGKIVSQLAEELRQNVKPCNSNPSLLQQLAPEAFCQPAQDFYQAMVEERDIHDLATTVAPDDYRLKAELLFFFLLRKNPSFGRISRIWETTRSFWQEVLPTDESVNPCLSIVSQKAQKTGPRLEIRGTVRSKQQGAILHPYSTYELVLPREVRLSVIWDKSKERFVTTDNLWYLSKTEQLGKDVRLCLQDHKGKQLRLEESVGYDSADRMWGAIEIQDVMEILDSSYIPVIPILAEPRTFMALVPADKSLEIAKAIKEKYEREMGKVRNRLPLHLGIVYAGRRTPLRAVLDAGRRMLKVPAWPENGWHVEEVQDGIAENSSTLPKGFQSDPHFSQWRCIRLSRDGYQVVWQVPLRMGDGVTEDDWYPYVFFDAAVEPVDRQRRLQTINPWTNKNGWLVHTSELQKDDTVYFMPATLDFEFLDTTSRRFEIAYDDQGQRRNPRKRTRPYLLDDLSRLKKLWREMSRLEKSQRRQVIAIIETIRETWFGDDQEGKSLTDNVFRQFVHDTLANAAWPKNYSWENIPNSQREELITAGAKGELADLAELHLQILKE